MSDSIQPVTNTVHDQVTSGTTGATGTAATESSSFGSKWTPPTNNTTTDPSQHASHHQHHHHHHQEHLTADQERRRSSLAATPNPMAPTDTSDKVPPSSSVGQQNAPGRAGSIGENVMGALGYGGATVQRPKEEQGLGEKIVNFLGA